MSHPAIVHHYVGEVLSPFGILAWGLSVVGALPTIIGTLAALAALVWYSVMIYEKFYPKPPKNMDD